MATLHEATASPPGAFAAHRTRLIRQPEDPDAERKAPRRSGPWRAQHAPRNPCARVRVHEGQTRPLHVCSGVDSTRHFRVARLGARSLPFGGRGGAGAAARTRGRGLGSQNVGGLRPPARAPGRRSPHFRGAEPPGADVGSRTRSSSSRRAAGSACCVASPSSFPPRSGGGASRSRRPASSPRAPASRPVSPAPRVRAPAPRPEKRLVPAARAPGAERPAPERRRASEAGAAGQVWRREHGRQTADPDGQREAQQEHHPARQRRQDLEKCSRREGVCRTLVIGSLHFCCVWFCNFPDYSKYQDGHVK